MEVYQGTIAFSSKLGNQHKLANKLMRLRSLFTGYFVPIVAAPFVGIGVDLATSLSRPSPILIMSLTVLAGTISTIAGVFVGLRAGIEIKKVQRLHAQWSPT